MFIQQGKKNTFPSLFGTFESNFEDFLLTQYCVKQVITCLNIETSNVIDRSIAISKFCWSQYCNKQNFRKFSNFQKFWGITPQTLHNHLQPLSCCILWVIRVFKCKNSKFPKNTQIRYFFSATTRKAQQPCFTKLNALPRQQCQILTPFPGLFRNA